MSPKIRPVSLEDSKNHLWLTHWTQGYIPIDLSVCLSVYNYMYACKQYVGQFNRNTITYYSQVTISQIMCIFILELCKVRTRISVELSYILLLQQEVAEQSLNLYTGFLPYTRTDVHVWCVTILVLPAKPNTAD